jgi:hypothetical protein
VISPNESHVCLTITVEKVKDYSYAADWITEPEEPASNCGPKEKSGANGGA